jgi:hypothetical protein
MKFEDRQTPIYDCIDMRSKDARAEGEHEHRREAVCGRRGGQSTGRT